MSHQEEDVMDARGRRDNQAPAPLPTQQQQAYGDGMPTIKEFEDVNYRSGFQYIGKVMIISNTRKVIEEKSHRESEELRKLFTELGFTGVITGSSNEPQIVFKDVTKKRLQQLLKDASDDKINDYSEYSCFVCIILSNGETGIVECVKDEAAPQKSTKYEISEMQNFFKGHKCETLKMKPKLFFIQASPFSKSDKMDDPHVPEKIHPDVVVRKIPREADILTQVCNIQDFDDGSPMSYYPRALKEAFEKYVLNKEQPMELNTLLIRVNGLIKQYLEKSDLTPNKEIPIPVVTTLLTKHMYFNKSVN